MDKKKVAIMMLSNRIILSGRSARTRNLIGLYNYLKYVKGYEVDFISKKLTEEYRIKNYIDLKDVKNINDYDELYINNSPANLYGGFWSDIILYTTKFILDFDNSKPIYYCYSDPNLYIFNPIVKFLNGIDKNYDDKNKWIIEKYFTDVNIIKFYHKHWICLFGGFNYKNLLSNDNFNAKYFEIKESEIFPIHEFYSMNNKDLHNPLFKEINKIEDNYNINNKEFDLIYIGNMRSHRKKTFDKFFSNGLSKVIVGFNPQYWHKYENTIYLKYTPIKLLHTTFQRTIASITLGDPLHYNNFITPRWFENIIYSLINFIDINYDSEKKLYHSQMLKDFCYVKDNFELMEKINYLKKDNNFYKTILMQQRQELNRFKKYELNDYEHFN